MAYPDVYDITANALGVSAATAIVILTIIGIWSLVWKGFALWKSAKRDSKIWFIVLLIVNTAGILEILYIFVFSELGRSKRTVSRPIKKSESKSKKVGKK